LSKEHGSVAPTGEFQGRGELHKHRPSKAAEEVINASREEMETRIKAVVERARRNQALGQDQPPRGPIRSRKALAEEGFINRVG
jgi:hypothetical protein